MLAWVDRVQRRHAVLAFPYAVLRKYDDDEAGRDAALIAYYGFLSVFPLLLLGVAVVSRALVRDAGLRESVVEAIVPPALGATVDEALASLPTSTLAFVAGLVGLLLSATGVAYSVDRTVNHVAAVPRGDRAGAVVRFLRAVLTVVVLLAGVVAVGCLTVVVAALPGLPLTGRVVVASGSAVIAFAVLLACGWLLLDRPVPVRELCLPAAIGAALVAAMLHLGTRLLAFLVAGAGPVYGGFATVAGVFTLLSLLSHGLVLAAEVAAVRHARLWPRAVDRSRPTVADARALLLLCREQDRTPALRVDVSDVPADQPSEVSRVAGQRVADDGRGEQGEGQRVQPAHVREREPDRPVALDADVHGVRQRDRRDGSQHQHHQTEQDATGDELARPDGTAEHQPRDEHRHPDVGQRQQDGRGQV
ncbi:hypothetical protein GCM10009557_43590 [Virgisporangium ochraceum]